MTEVLTDDFGNTEEDVKIRIIVPLLEKLGIDKSLLDFERYTGSGLIDIYFESHCGNGLVIETKNPKFAITESDLEQLLQYQRQVEALIGLITNGNDFFLVSQLPLRKKFIGTKILAYFTGEELTNATTFEILRKFISLEALNNPDLENMVIDWKIQREGLFSELEETESTYNESKTQKEREMTSLLNQQVLVGQSIKELKQEIQSEKSEYDDRIHSIYEEIGISRLKTKETNRNLNSNSRVRSSDLKKLPIGQEIFLRYKNKVYHATVTSDRKIKLESGEEYNSPSTAAKKIKESLGSSSPNTNGWTAWRTILPDGQEVTLDHFRP